MASITFTVGTVSATRNYADNQKAARILALFADEMNIPDTLPAQERLEKTVDAVVAYIVRRGRQRYIHNQEVAAAVEAEGLSMG